MNTPKFAPEMFELDPRVQNFQLDQEVASVIANTLWDADKATHQGGNSRVKDHVVVDPTAETKTLAVIFSDQENPENDDGYRVSFDAGDAKELPPDPGYRYSSLIPPVNASFAQEMRHAMLDAERRNRTGLAGSLAGSAVISAIPEGFAAILAETGHNTGDEKALIFGAGALGAAAFLQVVGVPKHLVRLNIAKPDTHLNKRHLRAAAKIAHNLKLPPVVYSN